MEYTQILNNIKNDIPFAISRRGDGEMLCLDMVEGKNCDNHQYFPAMCQRLRNVVGSNPKYVLGMTRMGKKHIAEYVKDKNIKRGYGSGISTQNMDEGITELIDALKEKDVLLVGPDRLKKVEIHNEHISVPLENAWLEYDRILNDIYKILDTKEKMVVVFCVGMNTNILIDDIYNKYGDKFTLLDIGSALDPYIGIYSRLYIPKVLQPKE